MPIGDIRPSTARIQAGNVSVPQGAFGQGIASALRGLSNQTASFALSQDRVADAQQNLELAERSRQTRLTRANINATLIRTETALSQEAEEIRRTMPADGTGLTEAIHQTVSERLESIRADIPDDLWPEYETDFERIQSSFDMSAYETELEAGDTAYVNSIEELTQQAVNEITLGTASAEQWRDRLGGILDTSVLGEAATFELADEVESRIGIAEYAQEVQRIVQSGEDIGELPNPNPQDVVATGLNGVARGVLNGVAGAPSDSWQGLEEVQAGIFEGESGGDYNALFGFSNRSGEPFANINVSEMTVGEVIEFTLPDGAYGRWVRNRLAELGQDPRIATPVGAYQIVGTTLRNAVAELGIDLNAQFDQETQDQLGRWVLDNQGTGAWEGYRGPREAAQPDPAYYSHGDTTFSGDAHPGGRAGRYDITQEDWGRASAALGIDEFSPANQDRAAWWLMQEAYGEETGRNLSADLQSGDQVRIESARRRLAAMETGHPGSAEPLFPHLQDMTAQEFYDRVTRSPATNPGVLYDERFADIPIDQRMSIYSDAASAEQERITGLQRQADQSRTQFLDDLGARLEMGVAGERDIVQAQRDYNLRATELQDLVESLEGYRGQASQDQSFGSRLSSEFFAFNPSMQSERQAADQYALRNMTEPLSERDNDAFASQVTPVIGRMGYVPAPIAAELGRLVRAPGENQDFALEAMASIYTADAEAFNRAFGDEQSRLMQYITGAGRYHTGEQRQSLISRFMNPNLREYVEEADDLYREARTEQASFFQPETILRGIGARRTDVSPQMAQGLQVEFSQLFRSGLQAGLDVNEAQSSAHELLQMRWGESQTGMSDPYVMRRPPEWYYSFGNAEATTQLLEEQVRAEFELEGAFRLASDGQTEHEIDNGTAPSYMVVTENEFGHMTPLINPDTGLPERMAFDTDMLLQNSLDEFMNVRETHSVGVQISDYQELVNSINGLMTEGTGATDPGMAELIWEARQLYSSLQNNPEARRELDQYLEESLIPQMANGSAVINNIRGGD